MKIAARIQTRDPLVVFSTRESPLLPAPPPPLARKAMLTPLPSIHSYSSEFPQPPAHLFPILMTATALLAECPGAPHLHSLLSVLYECAIPHTWQFL